jgi:hypothetical protein
MLPERVYADRSEIIDNVHVAELKWLSKEAVDCSVICLQNC